MRMAVLTNRLQQLECECLPVGIWPFRTIEGNRTVQRWVIKSLNSKNSTAGPFNVPHTYLRQQVLPLPLSQFPRTLRSATSAVSSSVSLSRVRFSFHRADSRVCGRESVWEPDDSVRVGGPGRLRGFLYDDVREEEPSPFYLSPLLPSSPLPCTGPRLLQEHRKGGREIIDCTAANK